jgi:hypothetical protein
MLQHLLTLTLFAGFVSMPLAAQNTDAQQKFAGTWEAKYKDKVICSMKLQSGDAISGAMYGCSINVDEKGELKEPDGSPDDPDKPEPLLNPKLSGDTLGFEMKDEGDDKPMKMEFRLTGQGQGELRFLDAPVEVKPIRFERK